MYLAVGVVAAIILVLASPIIWVVWWLLADLAEAAGNPGTATSSSVRQGHRRAA